MTEIPKDLKFAETHEWIKKDGDNYIVGISDYAQAELTDIVFVELPDVDTEVEKGDGIVVVESVKAASDVYSPLSGKVIEINETLSDDCSLVNTSPYEKGWLFKISPNNPDQINSLLNANDYQKSIS